MERISDYVVLDMEMTGLNPKNDRVIEIGAVRVRQGRLDEEYATLVDCGKPVPAPITELTGITDEMARSGIPTDEAMEGLLAFLGEDLLVGQNVRFDYSFLAQWCINRRKTLSVKACDTLKIARAVLPGQKSRKLEDLCRYFAIPRENAHRALDDARETALLFEKLQDLLLTQPEVLTGSGHKAEDLLTPHPLIYKAKRQTPATAHQLKLLATYRERHGLTDEVDFTGMTRSEASRLQDYYYSVYGR